MSSDLPRVADTEPVAELAPLGVLAFTTTRAAGSFGTSGDEPVHTVMGRWDALRSALEPLSHRLASASQVHGHRVVEHASGWEGWLRVAGADGHASRAPGTALAVTIADCVPVFIAHPGGSIALLHSGWRGTVARIVERGIATLVGFGHDAADLHVHLGPAICGGCYEVSPDVFGQLTGRSSESPATVDLRSLIAGRARAAGVREISSSPLCTRCDNGMFYSHRAGDAGRQLAVMVARSPRDRDTVARMPSRP